MLDRSGFWPVPPVADARLAGDGLDVRLLPPVPQIMVSGALEAFCMAQGLAPPVGLLGHVVAPRYALRLARHRMLAVGVSQDHAASGWTDGIATSPMTGALAVLVISGPGRMELFARASAIDPHAASPSASLNFAGVTAALCQDDQSLRLHVDCSLVPYVFDWIAASGMTA